jgi:hypothetical protein
MKTIQLNLDGTTVNISGTRISREAAIDALEKMKAEGYGGFFSAITKRRTDSDTAKAGDLLKMTCRFNVQKGKKGGSQPYDPSRRGLITVYCTEAGGFRQLNLLDLICVTYAGKTYLID